MLHKISATAHRVCRLRVASAALLFRHRLCTMMRRPRLRPFQTSKP